MRHNFDFQGERIAIYSSERAWGDGTHETTKAMLELIRKMRLKGKTVIDIGTGSGILSVLCKKMGAERILALDIDSEALEWARKNFKRNHVEVEAEIHDCLDPIDEKADIVLANLPAAEQYENMKHVYNNISEHGYLVMTWQKQLPIDELTKDFEIIDCIEGIDYDCYVLEKTERKEQ